MPDKKIFDMIHESVKSLHDADIIDNLTMKKFEERCLPPEEPLSQTDKP